MILRVPVTFASIADWTRKCATAVNALIKQAEAARSVPLDAFAAEPVDPSPGAWYFDTTTGKARMYDGVAWNDLW